jgi:NAD(P)-dependent dehydrogenase (short-subunit alcohol dehydrogenase family)
MCTCLPTIAAIILVILFLIHQVLYKKYRGNENLSGKVIVITGGTSGIGEVSTVELLLKGATVIFTGRKTERAKATIQNIITRLRFYNFIEGPLKKMETEERVKSLENGKWTEGGKNFESKYLNFRYIDQGKFSSCKNFIEWFNGNFAKLDVLMNNAGLITYKKKLESEEGLEMTMAVNHFSHLIITDGLLDKLKNAKEARVINVSSMGHLKMGKMNPRINLDDFFNEKAEKFEGFIAYSQSKLANVLFTNWLNRYFIKEGIDAKSVSLHPGAVATEIFRDFSPILLKVMKVATLFVRTSFEGAQTMIMTACMDFAHLAGGEYYDNCKIGAMNSDARDRDYCQKFMQKSVEIVNSKGFKLSHF